MINEVGFDDLNDTNFETQNANPKYSPQEKIVRFLVREVNSNKLSYVQ